MVDQACLSCSPLLIALRIMCALLIALRTICSAGMTTYSKYTVATTFRISFTFGLITVIYNWYFPTILVSYMVLGFSLRFVEAHPLAPTEKPEMDSCGFETLTLLH